MALKPTSREVIFAQAMLRYLGADAKNPYLITAIIAWIRAESGQRYLGNNPLNIRNSKFANGFRQTKSNGKFATFKNLAIAGKASAYFLLHNKGHGYEAVIRELRKSVSGTTKSYQDQGIRFLNALAKSDWSSGHYGFAHKVTYFTYPNGPNGAPVAHTVLEMYPQKTMTWNWMLQHNKLISIWGGILGQKFTIPADPQAPEKVAPAPKQPPQPKQPRSFINDVTPREYISPYQSRDWYEERSPRRIAGDDAYAELVDF
jgi:hypothetical protein